MSEISTLATIDGGQLGLMIGREMHHYDVDLRFFDPMGAKSPVALEGFDCMQGGLKDPEAIERFIRSAGKDAVFGYGIEHIVAEPLQRLADEGYDIQCSPDSLAMIQNKITQKNAFIRAGLPVAPYRLFNSAEDLAIARDIYGKVIVKAAEGGYDGRGNYKPKENNTYEDIVAELGGDKAGPLLVEQLIDFDRELAVVGVRDANNEISLYPVVQTVHADSICHTVYAPAEISPDLNEAARELGRNAIEITEGRGVFAVELMQKGDRLYITEMAPRVHNSAHWTLDGAVTSQFENHGRALLKLPLGTTAMRPGIGATVMTNILHARMPADVKELRRNLSRLVNPSGQPGVKLHTYNKLPRENSDARKIAHFNVRAKTMAEAIRIASDAQNRVQEDYLASLEV